MSLSHLVLRASVASAVVSVVVILVLELSGLGDHTDLAAGVAAGVASGVVAGHGGRRSDRSDRSSEPS